MYTLFFLLLLKTIYCVYSLEPPGQGDSNEYPQSLFWVEIWKISELLFENFQFWVLKLSKYLNRHIFIMGAGIYPLFNHRNWQGTANYSLITASVCLQLDSNLRGRGEQLVMSRYRLSWESRTWKWDASANYSGTSMVRTSLGLLNLFEIWVIRAAEV